MARHRPPSLSFSVAWFGLLCFAALCAVSWDLLLRTYISC